MIKVDVDKHLMKKADKLLKEIPNGMKKTTKNAINKTVPRGGNALHTQLKTDYNIKVAEVKRGLSVKKATFSRLEGFVIANGPVTRLKKGFKTNTAIPKSYAAYIKKRRKKSLPEQAFVQTMPNSGHVGIFLRTGKKMKSNEKKEAIRELTGPSVAGMARSQRVVVRVQKELTEKFNENFEKEVQRTLKKYSS